MVDPRKGGAPYTPDPRPPAKDTTYVRQQEYRKQKLQDGAKEVRMLVDGAAFRYGYDAFEPGVTRTLNLNSDSPADVRAYVCGWYKAYNEWLRTNGKFNVRKGEAKRRLVKGETK